MFFIIMLVLIVGSIVAYPFIMLLEAIIVSISESISNRSWVPVLVVFGFILLFIVIPALINAAS